MYPNLSITKCSFYENLCIIAIFGFEPILSLLVIGGKRRYGHPPVVARLFCIQAVLVLCSLVSGFMKAGKLNFTCCEPG